MSETPTAPTWTAEDFYKGASKPNQPTPAATPASAQPAATKTAQEVVAEDFFAKAARPTAETGKAVQPTPPAAPAPTATATPADPATAAAAANLRTLGVVVEGVSDSQLVAANDAALKAARATEDATVASWEAESRRTIPAHEIAAAETFAATLDGDVREVLASSGLGSHPAIIRLAAKLAVRGAP
jgi:hypothetical protein